VLHGRLAELVGVHPILSYGGSFDALSSPTEPYNVGNSFSLLRGSGGRRRGLATVGLLLLGSPSMRGLSGGWFAMGCVPMAPPSSCGARQGSGWGKKVVERRDDGGERG
jgi:hypothetical protein